MDGIKEKLLEEGKSRFQRTLDYYNEEYQRGGEDVDFALGAQWDEAELRKRSEDSRPALTENHLMPFVEQIVNSAREMRPSVKVSPVDDLGDTDTAEVFKGAIRNIERQSKASVAYDTAVQNSVMSGYGWIRVNTDYSDPMSFTQEAKIEAVVDWRSAMLDPAHEMIDGSDAEYGFIYKDIEKTTFEKEYPDHDPVDFDGEWAQGTGEDEKVRIVEYFYKEHEIIKIYECLLQDGSVQVLTKTQKEDIEKAGFYLKIIQERETRLPTVKWCKLYGNGILEETEWLGQYIPLVPVYGKLVWHKERLKSYSLIKHAKDPQRMLNIVKTTIAEIVGSQPKNQPMVGAVGQFDTDGRWENANVENYATLEYDLVFATDEVTNQSMLAPPPMKQQPLQVSPALFQIEANAQLGIKASLGMYEENRGDESNAISGVAIKARQLRGDKSTFHFIDNLASSIRHVGVILIDLIPKLYTRKQIMRIIGSDDKEKTITIDPNAQTNKVEGIYNLNVGKYDVDTDIGPSYATQQQEFLDISKELMGVNPDYAMLAGDKIIEAAGGPYAEVIAERIRANMPAEMQSDDPMAMKLMEVMKELQATKEQEQMLMAALEDKKKNEAEELNIKKGELGVKQEQAKTQRLETLAKIEEMKIKAEGNEKEALADFADAITDMDADSQETKQVLSLIMDKLEMLDGAMQGATNPPQGNPPA